MGASPLDFSLRHRPSFIDEIYDVTFTEGYCRVRCIAQLEEQRELSWASTAPSAYRGLTYAEDFRHLSLRQNVFIIFQHGFPSTVASLLVLIY